MDAFRSQGLKSAVYGSIVIAIGVVFVIQFRQGPQGATRSLKNECVAEVRGECLSTRDFRSTMALAAPRADDAKIRQLQLRKLVLDGLVERALLAQDADRLGITISDDDLNGELTAGHALLSLSVDAPPFIDFTLGLPEERPMRLLEVKGPSGKFDIKTYDKSLKLYVGRGQAEFREMQRQEQLAARMRDVVKARVRVSEAEVFDIYEHEKGTASVRYVKILRPWIAKHMPRTKEAVAAFADAHKAEVDSGWENRKAQYLPECRKAQHILVKAGQTASDEEKTAAQKKVEDARARVEKGESFDEVARQLSEDSSADEGGALGCFQKGRMVKAFEDAVFSMKPGELSPIIETEYGFHVIKLNAVLSGPDAEAAGRFEVARDLMLAGESETKAAEAGKKIMASVAAGKSMEDAVRELLAQTSADEAAGARKKGKKTGAAPSDPAAPAAPAAKVEDPDEPRVEESKDFTLAGSPITNAGPGVDPAQIAFALKKPGEVAPDLVKLENGYAVMQLIDRKPATRESFDKEREKFTRPLLAMKQRDALSAYVARLREVAKGETKMNQAYAVDKTQPEDPPE